MSKKPFMLEEFGLATRSAPKAEQEEVSSEKTRLEAFEQGYQAGWDDANAAQNQDQSRITAELEASFKDLSFSFHEARNHILQGIEPLIREVVDKILPTFSKQGLPDLVAERLNAALGEATDRPVVLSVSPASRAAVEAALPSSPGFPITIKEESTLSDGQVFLNFGASEESLDLDETLSSLQIAVREFFEINKKAQNHG